MRTAKTSSCKIGLLADVDTFFLHHIIFCVQITYVDQVYDKLLRSGSHVPMFPGLTNSVPRS